MPKFDISLVIEADDMQSALGKVYQALDKHEDAPLSGIVSRIWVEPTDA